MISQQLIEAAQRGIDLADEGLAKKSITEKVNKIDEMIYNESIKYRYNALMTNLQRMGDNISLNSNKLISEIKNSVGVFNIDEQKKISTKILEQFSKMGLTSFKDAGGKTWDMKRYVDMLVLTETARATRQAMFTRALEYGKDLVRVIHLGIHPECELCKPFTGKILSIDGSTPGYMTVSDAQDYGLHHIFCDHVENIEFAPEDDGTGADIELNEANKKNKARLNAKN